MNLKGRNFLTLKDFTKEEILYLLDLSAELKDKKKKGIPVDHYKGKNVYVIGGADGAVKEALYLAKIADKVTIVCIEEELACIQEFKDKAAACDNIEIMPHASLTAVYGREEAEELEFTDHETGEKRIVKDSGCGVFVYAGIVPNTQIYTELKLDGGYIPVDASMQTEIPGVFAAGDICVKKVRQVATAVSDGAVAGIQAAAMC